MLYEGKVIGDTYQISGEIGSGGMGVVYLAYHLRLEKYVVMKKIKSRGFSLSLLRNEVDILKRLHHPYLPQVYDILEHEGDVYTVIDYIDGCDLEKYIESGCVFSQGQLIKWLRQLCEVLVYLHGNNPTVIHTDIKPANIIVRENGDICLIDFGISLSADYDVKGYSRNYSSPEQYRNVMNVLNGCEQYNEVLDGRTDIYSLGASFYHLMTGYLPDVEDEYQPALSQFDLPYSQSLVSIVEKAMQRDIRARYKTAEKMLAAIDNLKKQDSRYKKYIALQIASSAASAVLICAGVLLVFTGNNEQINSEFAEKYTQFTQLCSKGSADAASESAGELLNNASYRSALTEEKKAEIYYNLGECYFEAENYLRAGENYKNAYDCADTENDEAYLRDYAIALISQNDLSGAQEAVYEAQNKFPASPIVSLLTAELAYETNSTDEAIASVEECLKSVEDGSDNKFNALLLYGDILYNREDCTNALQSYEQARQIHENALVYRRLARAYLALGAQSGSSNDSDLSRAKEYYGIIDERFTLTVSDGINYAQAYELSGDLQGAKNVLENLKNSYPDDCRVYMQLAVVCSEQNDSMTASYCEKARQLYSQMSDEEKMQVDGERLQKVKKIYKKYVGSAW